LNKEGKLKAKRDELEIASLHMASSQAMQSPSLAAAKMSIDRVVANVNEGMLAEKLGVMNVMQLKAIKHTMDTSNNEKNRIEAIAKEVFHTDLQEVEELEKMAKVVKSGFNAAGCLMTFSDHMNSSGRVSWDVISKRIEDLIDAKNREEGAGLYKQLCKCGCISPGLGI
jgi:hypothetical protein